MGYNILAKYTSSEHYNKNITTPAKKSHSKGALRELSQSSKKLKQKTLLTKNPKQLL